MTKKLRFDYSNITVNEFINLDNFSEREVLEFLRTNSSKLYNSKSILTPNEFLKLREKYYGTEEEFNRIHKGLLLHQHYYNLKRELEETEREILKHRNFVNEQVYEMIGKELMAQKIEFHPIILDHTKLLSVMETDFITYYHRKAGEEGHGYYYYGTKIGNLGFHDYPDTSHINAKNDDDLLFQVHHRRSEFLPQIPNVKFRLTGDLVFYKLLIIDKQIFEKMIEETVNAASKINKFTLNRHIKNLIESVQNPKYIREYKYYVVRSKDFKKTDYFSLIKDKELDKKFVVDNHLNNLKRF